MFHLFINIVTMKILYFCLLILMFIGCKEKSATELYVKSRTNVVKVKDKVCEVMTEEPFISNYSDVYLLDGYLIVKDLKGYDNLIHIFDKNTFEHVKSTGTTGQGPNEIANIGNIFIDEKCNNFYVVDQGRLRLLSYNLDSLLSVENYSFAIKADLKKSNYPSGCFYITDTFTIAKQLSFEENSGGAIEACGVWNMKTNEFKKGYIHPSQSTKAINTHSTHFDASESQGVYVMCSRFFDVMTICNLDGTLKYNVYGPNWKDGKSDKIHYNMDVCIGGDKIYALYSGANQNSDEYYPTKMLVYDVNGNYLKTLDIGYRVLNFCYDEEHHRLILHADDDIQFGYLDLEGII